MLIHLVMLALGLLFIFPYIYIVSASFTSPSAIASNPFLFYPKGFNLPPRMIREIMHPLYRKFEQEFGSVMLHYCCLPAPSAHVAPALAGNSGISAVDNWQGYRTLLNENDFFQTAVAVCTDVNKNEILNGSIFKDEFIMFDRRPLVVSTSVENADEGKRVYEIWRTHFGEAT